MPATFFGDEITEITFHGDQIDEVTLHGDVVWQASTADWRANTTLVENFEGYSSQADLESSWDFGVAPAAYELNTADPLEHDQDIAAQQDTAHAPNPDITTPWDSHWSVLVRPEHSNNSPGLSVQHQPNWGSRLDDCYWCQADFGNNILRVYLRENGSTVETVVSDSIPTGLSMANKYRIQVDLRATDNNVRARLFNSGEDPAEVTPLANTGFGLPSTIHSGGHIMLNSGREGTSNTQFDNVREH